MANPRLATGMKLNLLIVLALRIQLLMIVHNKAAQLRLESESGDYFLGDGGRVGNIVLHPNPC